MDTKKPVLANIAILFALSKTWKSVAVNSGFKPRQFKMQSYVAESMPGIICRMTNYPIAKVSPRYQVGAVFSYQVEPVKSIDPVIVMSEGMNLTNYYIEWGRLLDTDSADIPKMMGGYDSAVELAIRSARVLSKDELHFAIYEMLNFRNEMMSRWARASR